MKIVYNEFYGELSYAQQAAYRKYNVSPSDHDDLLTYFNSDQHALITETVKRNSPNGMFSVWHWRNDRPYGPLQ